MNINNNVFYKYTSIDIHAIYIYSMYIYLYIQVSKDFKYFIYFLLVFI